MTGKYFYLDPNLAWPEMKLGFNFSNPKPPDSNLGQIGLASVGLKAQLELDYGRTSKSSFKAWSNIPSNQ